METTTDLPLVRTAVELPIASNLDALSDGDLVARLKGLVRIERKAAALVVAHLIEFDRRKLYAPLGFGSLFAYCVAELGYSEDSACKRILGARAAAKFPAVLARLETGELHLAGLALLSRHLTDENCVRLLAESSHRSKREIEAIIANLAPEADLPDSARSIGNGRIQFRFCGTEHLRNQLERARDILRHKHPSRRFEAVFSEALSMLLSQQDLDHEPRRRPRNNLRTTNASRFIPKWIKQLVWKRDGGRCAFVARDDRRCEERAWLEFDHVVPWALGGSSTDAGNIRLLCWTHNQMMAREAFGSTAIGPRKNGNPPRGG